MKILVSPFNNPFINLALEDYFLRGGTDLPALFFYVNRPCVVLGRFQNPWIETNLSYLTQNDIWLVRRQSGGGCVFHDFGNLNFSFIVPDSMVDKNKHAKIIQSAFQKTGIELQISPRNDLWLQDYDNDWKKVSGSAYKQTREASFHHGTFLVNSDLDKLEESLKQTLVSTNSKSIASVRSKVIALGERHPGFEISDVVDLIAHELKTIPIELDGSFLSRHEVQESFNNLRSWEWMWGETPLFEIERDEKVISIKKGILLDTKERFGKESMKGILSQEEMEKYFPDFSEQHKSSNQIL